jgi:PAS domain-containing protein
VERLGNWASVIHPEDWERVECAFWEAARDGEDLRIEFRVAHPDGGLRWRLVTSRTFRAIDRSSGRMIGLSIDITERKEAEQALRDADRRKNELRATLAHELRNPLAPAAARWTSCRGGF